MKKEEPLLSFDYERGRVFWKLFFPYGLGVLLFSGVFFSLYENVLLNGCNVKECFGLVFFGFSYRKFIIINRNVFP